MPSRSPSLAAKSTRQPNGSRARAGVERNGGRARAGVERSASPPITVDLEALLCALVLAPATFSRNRFFGLFTHPDARRVRARAAELRTMVRKLSGRRAPRARLLDEQVRADGSAVLKYAIDDLGFVHTAMLDPIEVSAFKFALHRATDGRLPLLSLDRDRVEQALVRLAPEMRPPEARPLDSSPRPL